MKLTDICDVQGGSQPPKEEWSFEEQEGYIRMLQIRDFTQSERVTPEYIKISNSTKICEADDILIARYGASIGKILTGLAGAYNVAIMRTIPDTSKIKKKYLYYYLKSPYFQNAILNVGSRAAQAGFNKEDLSKLDIECPELSEQENIASILDKVEIVIRKRKEELVFLDKLIKARFVEMFGDAVANPMKWPIKKLKELSVQINSGNTPKGGSENYVEEGITFFRSQNVWKDRLEMDDIVYIDAETHASMKRSILLKECATIPEVKAKLPQLKELINDDYWNTQDILKFEETRKSLRSIMKFIPVKKIKIHYTNFEDEVVFREEGRKLDLTSDDFEDYKERVNEYIEAHKSQPTINKLLHNEPISIDDYQELERIFTEELGTCEDYQMNYQDTPFGLLIRKIAKMNRDAAYAAFSSFIAEERPNAEQIHFIEQVVDYVVENGYINNVLDLMKAPFDRPYKFSMIFTRDEQIKFVQIINSIKNNALIA